MPVHAGGTASSWRRRLTFRATRINGRLVYAPKSSTRRKVPVHRAIARLGGIALSCMLALSSARCVNDMISVDDSYTYSNGGGFGSRPGSAPLGHDPDSLNTFIRHVDGRSSITAARESFPGSATAH